MALRTPLDPAPILLSQPRRVRVAFVGNRPAHFLLFSAAASAAADASAPSDPLLLIQLLVVPI